MTIEIKTPTFPESVADGTVATWYKKPGEAISRDELIVDIETDKVVLEVVASADGVLKEILKGEGEVVLSAEVLGLFEEGGVASAAPVEAEAEEAKDEVAETDEDIIMSPAARKMAKENGISATDVVATGKDGRVTKEDILNHLKTPKAEPAPVAAAASAPAPADKPATNANAGAISFDSGDRIEKRVPMTRLRATIARRLVSAQQNAAMLTTYNEVNMKPIMEMRKKYQDRFVKAHGVKLGFMSFFVKAATEALKKFPAVNASIDGSDMIYHGYQDIGVAVSTERGLVVPILRDTDAMGLAEVESTIGDFGARARDGKLGIDEMQGGTFTISNGGTFGSLLSTPILNPPQTAIMGMHKIQDRPMAIDGEVVILPMMYLALSYDHRMIDGKEAVQFLVAIKDMLEDPARLLLDI
ncbi:2-oxoglutarate dehydrogenase, E2 component (dihydrolipoamide succinyltransferase) [Oleispira antarctica RB-8]|uniref:Dihydrolipoyllysine-residue succinyltransferase component of 2-oxoglutarate dehydrogenase complex n=1 Tax=Oleispira antarctica RB-8 TaxID=698738 RepID=R4YLX4_OLEAN|nr:2-oxoglutarate dehydrogenase, E2 component (dihydrolipoamide succinyltransferase) [Oleispira antarctica RB-8]|tara:strand:- start:18 stop:1259 length:1242 start_codon:yes stop_codon:yes gene_type:complete